MEPAGSGIHMAAKLPSSGSLPDGQSPGCDTSGLILVHRIFRWLYSELPILVREVEAGADEDPVRMGDGDRYRLDRHFSTSSATFAGGRPSASTSRSATSL